MAAIYKTIAASGADYTSLSAAEASIPGSSADDFTFEYIGALTDTTPVTFSAASFTGTVLVTVAAAYRCEGAVSGSHASLEYSVNNTTHLVNISMPDVTISHLRMIRSGTTNNVCTIIDNSAGPTTVTNCTVIMRSGGANPMVYFVDSTPVVFAGNYVIRGGANSVASMVMVRSNVAVRTSKVYRNTFFQPSNNLGSYLIARGANETCDAQQNVALKAAGLTNTAGYGVEAGGSYAASSDHNVSSEAANAPGTNGTNSAVAANVLTDLTDGAENLDYKNYAAMSAFGTGNDLSATVGTTDIHGDTIGGWYPGADYIFPPAASGRRGLRSRMRLGL